MRSGNLSSQSARISEVGLVWKTMLGTAAAPAAGTIKVKKYSSIRVRATAPCDIKLDGVNSISLLAGDDIIINVGAGVDSVSYEYVKVEFSGAVLCSVAEM